MKSILSLSLLVCIFFFSCKSQIAPSKSSNKAEIALVDTKWILTKLNGDVLNLTNTELEQPFLKLNTKDNGVGGNGGCNSFGGTFILKDDQQIEFTQMMSTMRYCEGSTIEGVFMGNLQKAKNYILTDGELTLVDENGHELVAFKPSTEKTQ